eukprot:TRINITY_DN6549_c0_g1_i1.p1 TRINITY_DN6549_c0_g1~~TRINITY_DN6549_c0_g1_i1.p1  ORF type:complete len:162 (-),score=61.64 TRINITY_DN6549_c0_g1_i1:145-630(-)
MSQSAPIDLSKLTEEQRLLYKKYGRITPPTKSELLLRKNKKQRFDSADFYQDKSRLAAAAEQERLRQEQAELQAKKVEEPAHADSTEESKKEQIETDIQSASIVNEVKLQELAVEKDETPKEKSQENQDKEEKEKQVHAENVEAKETPSVDLEMHPAAETN